MDRFSPAGSSSMDVDQAELPRQRSEADCRSWVTKVNEVQTSRLTPEKREELKAKVERSRVAESSRQKVRACRGHAMRSKALVNEGLRQMQSVSAPEEYGQVQQRWSSAQHASEERSDMQMRRVQARSAAQEAVVLRHQEEDDEEEAGLAEASALVGSVGPLAPAPPDAGGAGGAAAGEADEFKQLLEQLRAEPRADEELAAKFALYETYGEQVEKMRNTLFGVYDENKAGLPAAIQNDMDKQLKKIDSTVAMGIPDDARGWFVFHMMAKAGKNNDNMGVILSGFEKKLEFLANNDQNECPICLDEFSDALPAQMLGCCHKVCNDCWQHWSSVMHGHPFCPLCRNDEFVETLHHHANQ